MLPRKINFFDSDDLFDFFKPTSFDGKVMQTDILEKDGNYLLEIEMAGFNKEDIKIHLENGYLTVMAEKNEEKEEKQKGYLRKERFSGSCQRKYYIGDVLEKDIKANYQNGILTLTFPKENKKIESKKYIAIE